MGCIYFETPCILIIFLNPSLICFIEVTNVHYYNFAASQVLSNLACCKIIIVDICYLNEADEGRVKIQGLGSQGFQLFGQVGRVFANGPGDPGSILDHVIQKTFKMVLDTSLLNTQQYKLRIEDKVEQSRERSSAFPYSLV